MQGYIKAPVALRTGMYFQVQPVFALGVNVVISPFVTQTAVCITQVRARSRYAIFLLPFFLFYSSLLFELLSSLEGGIISWYFTSIPCLTWPCLPLQWTPPHPACIYDCCINGVAADPGD